jgi:hypothetical protein
VTSEPWYPIPPDEPYGELGDASSASHGGLVAGGASPSAPSPVPRITSPREGALTWVCRVCLLDFDEPYCSICGADLNLKYDRPPHRIREDRVRGADRSEV